jgi:multidrug efflux system membrane fusion protein
MNTTVKWLARPRVSLSVVAILIVVAVVWSYSRHGAQAADVREASSSSPAIAVDAATVGRRDVPGYLDGLGTVQAFYTVKVTARVDGQLDTVAFTEGQTLKKGQLLAQIDPRPFKASLDQALAQRAKDEAQLANAHRDMDRYMELAPQDLASKQTVDTQRATVSVAEATLKGDDATIENARTQLSYTTITAPIDGRTGIRQVDPGNIVHAADTGGIVVMTQIQPISVMFTLPEDEVPQMTEALSGGTVTVVALARNDGTPLDTGTVALLDNQIDQTTGTIRVKATFPNAHQRLWPGEFVTARVLVRVHKQALTIPSAALQRGPDGMFTYIIQPDSTVAVRALKVTLLDENTVIVDSGLTGGERVITSNLYRLEPGIRVRINGAAAKSGGPGPARS